MNQNTNPDIPRIPLIPNLTPFTPECVDATLADMFSLPFNGKAPRPVSDETWDNLHAWMKKNNIAFVTVNTKSAMQDARARHADVQVFTPTSVPVNDPATGLQRVTGTISVSLPKKRQRSDVKSFIVFDSCKARREPQPEKEPDVTTSANEYTKLADYIGRLENLLSSVELVESAEGNIAAMHLLGKIEQCRAKLDDAHKTLRTCTLLATRGMLGELPAHVAYNLLGNTLVKNVAALRTMYPELSLADAKAMIEYLMADREENRNA